MATARMQQTETETTRPLEPEPRRRHLRVVSPRDRAWLRLRLTPRVGITVTVLLFVALFAVAASHALLIEGQSRLDRLDSEVSREQARYEEMRAEVSALESPDRILDEAEELGMVQSEDPGWLPQSQPTGDGSGEEAPAETSSTSHIDMKPYLGTTTAP